MTFFVNSVAIRKRCQARYLAGKQQDIGPDTFGGDLDTVLFGLKLKEMKCIYAGLSFFCIYFLVPALAQAHGVSRITIELRDFGSAQASILQFASKATSCLVVRSAECKKRTTMASGATPDLFALTFSVDEIHFRSIRFRVSFGSVDSISIHDRKHSLRTGLSPPLLS
ncbi:hypothetical protein BH10BDE1_BH10BDE1_13990 [soil metagenome]